jgi:hypothetical protein
LHTLGIPYEQIIAPIVKKVNSITLICPIFV